jgi:small subunit ribosomal protein S16
MATKIRLARHGRKQKAFYHIVVADSKAPRDGKFIEKIGTYNPNTQPATVELDIDKAVAWMDNGAQPTDTANALLKLTGVVYKRHLLRGVKLGVVKEGDVEKKFNEFVEGRATKEQEKYDKAAEIAAAKAKAKAEAEAAAAEAAAEEATEEEAPAAEAEEAPAEEAASEEATEESAK